MYFLESFNDDRHSQIIVEVLFEKETIYVTPYARAEGFSLIDILYPIFSMIMPFTD